MQDVLDFLVEAETVRKEIVKKWQKGALATNPTCVKGCCHCCYQLVGTMFYEGLIIAAHILQQKGIIRDGLLKRAVLENIKPEDLECFIHINDTSCKTWFQKQIPCIFLKNSECLIYEWRPITCSTYYVQGNPENCKFSPETLGKKQVEMLNNNPLLKWSINTEQKLFKMLWGNNHVPRPYHLPYAVHGGLVVLVRGPDFCKFVEPKEN